MSDPDPFNIMDTYPPREPDYIDNTFRPREEQNLPFEGPTQHQPAWVSEEERPESVSELSFEALLLLTTCLPSNRSFSSLSGSTASGADNEALLS